MHLATNDIPVKIHTEGATARQQPDFGDAVGRLGAEHFKMQAGTDLAPLLKGLERDACQSAHWGYIIKGCVIVDYTDGTSETCAAGDMVHWPAGHSARVASTPNSCYSAQRPTTRPSSTTWPANSAQRELPRTEARRPSRADSERAPPLHHEPA
jgi:hypothetical protein